VNKFDESRIGSLPEGIRSLLLRVLEAATIVDRSHYHRHRGRDGARFGPGGCYSSMYEPCGEHHAHDMNCGSYPRQCWKQESSDEINRLHDALEALTAVPPKPMVGPASTIILGDVNTGDGGGFVAAHVTVSRKEPGVVDLQIRPNIVVRLSLSAAEDLQSVLAGGGESVVA
jgi:hypothetical protein